MLLLSLMLLLLCGASPGLGLGANPVAPPGCSASNGTCVRIGYWSCPESDSRCSSTQGHDRMIQWFQDRLASSGGAWHGVPVYWVEAVLSGFLVATPKEVLTVINATFIGLAAWNGGQPLVDFAILPFGSLWEQGMALLERWRIPSIASQSPDSTLYQCAANETVWRTQVGCSAPNTRRFQYAHGTTTPGENYFSPWIGLLKLRKAKSVAIVSTTLPFYSTVHAGIVAAATDNGIAIVYDRVAENVPGTPDVAEPYAVASVASVVDSRDVEAIVAELQTRHETLDGLAILAQDCVPFVRALAAANYSPQSIAALFCADATVPVTQLGPQLNYIVGSSQWDPGLSGTEWTENADLQPWALFPHIRGGATVGLTSPLRFQQLYRTLMNSTTAVPGDSEAATLVAYTMLEGAVSLAASVDPELVQAQLKGYYQPSFYGLLTTNRFGVNNQKATLTIQRDVTSQLHLIAPTSVATADFIYPMPRFSERVYARFIMDSTLEVVLLALVALCACFTASLMAYLFVNRTRQVFQAAGLVWYLLQGLGCLLGYAAVLSWMVENNDEMCRARVWMWTMAFHLFVDPLIASAFRISLILRRKMFESGKITNEQLLALCLVLVLPQALINVLWVTMAPLTPEVQTMDPLRPAISSWTSCVSQQARWGEGFAFVTLAYSCLLLLVACALAFRVRSASKLFNDARPIAVSVYLFTTLSAVVLVTQIALSHDSLQNERVLFGLRSVGLLVAFQGSIALLYLRRILRKRHSPALPGIRRVPVLGLGLGGRDDMLYSQHATRAAAAQRYHGMSALSSLASVGPFQVRGGGVTGLAGVVGGGMGGGTEVTTVSVTPLPSYADLLAMEQEQIVNLIEEYHAVLMTLQKGEVVTQLKQQPQSNLDQPQSQQHQQKQPKKQQHQGMDEATSSGPRDDDGSGSVSPVSQSTPSPDHATAAATVGATATPAHPSASPTDEAPLLRKSPPLLPQTNRHHLASSSSFASAGAAAAAPSPSSTPPPHPQAQMRLSHDSSAPSSAGPVYSSTPDVVLIHMDSSS